MAQQKSTCKLILIPEYKPLFAMRKCYGPPKGPLEKPCPTPISIIGELLLQSGRDQLTIYEVVKTSDKTFSDPVQLTRDNYMLTYDEIKNGVQPDPTLKTTKIVEELKAVSPVVITSGDAPVHKIRELNDTVHISDTTEKEKTPDLVPEVASNIDIKIEVPVSTEDATPEETPAVEDSTPAEEAPVEAPNVENTSNDEAAVETPVEEAPQEPTPAESTILDRYAGMSKAERRAARRAEREALAANNAVAETQG